MKVVHPEEAVAWDWDCPTCMEKDDCEQRNRTSVLEIEWRDTTPVVTCPICKDEFEFNFN